MSDEIGGSSKPVASTWRKFVLYGLSKVAPGVIMIAAVPLWTRAYGASEYGLYSICWAAALFSGSLFTGWLRQAILRHAGNADLSMGGLPWWVHAACSLVSVIPVVLVVGLQPNAPGAEELTIFLWASAVFSFFNSYYLVIQARAQRENEVGRYTLAEIVRIAAALGFSFAISSLLGLPGSIAIVIAYSIGTVLAILALTVARQTDPIGSLHSSRVLRQFWSYGWPMALWLTVSSLLLYLDRILIGFLLGSEAAGTYAAVSDLIVRGIGMLAFPITMTAHPEIMRKWNTGEQSGAILAVRQYTKYLWVLSLAVVVIGSIVGTPILEWFLGFHIPSPIIVPALLAGGALWQIALMSHKPLEMANKTRLMLVTILCVTVACVCLNLIFIPLFGLVVPALVFFLGALAYVVLTSSLSVRLTRGYRASSRLDVPN